MSAETLQRLLDIMAALRHPRRGCPWDRVQTWSSLAPYTLEEAYEVVEAVECGQPQAVCEELGDLLFHVVFYCQIARERGLFDFHAVAEVLADKLVRRHPHVFGTRSGAHAAEASQSAWEVHKQRERVARGGGHSLLDEVPQALPALSRAVKLQRRAAQVGFDWRHAGQVWEKVEEELEELRAELAVELAAGDGVRAVDEAARAPDPETVQKLEHELGDLLLAVSNLARHLGIDPETALRHANRRFERRFRHMEERLAARGRDMRQCDAGELEVLWEEAKRRIEG